VNGSLTRSRLHSAFANRNTLQTLALEHRKLLYLPSADRCQRCLDVDAGAGRVSSTLGEDESDYNRLAIIDRDERCANGLRHDKNQTVFVLRHMAV
jgi:hypothetical protein